MIKLNSALFFAALMASSPALADQPSDGKAIGYVVASNQGQVDLSKIARAKSKNEEVKTFAKQMIKVHEDRTSQFVALAMKIKVSPVVSPDSKALDEVLKKDQAALIHETGTAFDREFMQQEIDHHKHVITEIKDELLPSIKSADLKSVLNEMLPKIKVNLDRAEKILASLKDASK